MFSTVRQLTGCPTSVPSVLFAAPSEFDVPGRLSTTEGGHAAPGRGAGPFKSPAAGYGPVGLVAAAVRGLGGRRGRVGVREGRMCITGRGPLGGPLEVETRAD